MSTIEYQLNTDPRTKVMIPSEAKTQADLLLAKMHPLNDGVIPPNNPYIGVPLVVYVLSKYRDRSLPLDPAEDILTLNIAEQIAVRDNLTDLLGKITASQNKVRGIWLR